MADILFTLLGVAVIVLLWIMLYDSNRFVLCELSVSDRRIRRHKRAVVLADLHNKKYGRDNRELLEAIRKQKPDMILIAGDILTARPGKSMEPALELLGELSREYPIYYGNGNHEHRLKLYPETYGTMAEEYAEGLKKINIEPMVNCHSILEDWGIAIYGAEIDRKYYKRFRTSDMSEDYLQEILGKPDKGTYTVLLAHNPDYFPEYAAWGADLVLAGHVHGGVARIPFLGKGVLSPSLHLFPKYDGGIFKEGNSVMLLSRGLGMHTIPLRLFNPGELWVVDFLPEQEGDG
ncbi:MAG: metallophosphoesterase [Acetatifactor sp.]